MMEGEKAVEAMEMTDGEARKFTYFFKRSLLLCVLCAAPSFVFALLSDESFDVVAMLLGVAVFVVFYAWFFRSRWYGMIKEQPMLYEILRWSFGLKIVMAMIAFLFLTFGAVLGVTRNLDFGLVLMVPDLIAGGVALSIYNAFIGRGEDYYDYEHYDFSFVDTLCITLMEGVILSGMITVFALLLLVISTILMIMRELLRSKTV